MGYESDKPIHHGTVQEDEARVKVPPMLKTTMQKEGKKSPGIISPLGARTAQERERGQRRRPKKGKIT